MRIRVNHVFGAEVELLRRVLSSASFRWHDARVSMLIRRERRIWEARSCLQRIYRQRVMAELRSQRQQLSQASARDIARDAVHREYAGFAAGRYGVFAVRKEQVPASRAPAPE